MAKIKYNKILSKKPKNYDLISDIKSESFYRMDVPRRDARVRIILEDKCPTVNPARMTIGSMYLMDYFTPKTAEDLEYYDAKPCILLFGRFKTEAGEPRILGFSLHYYPPRYRWAILSKIFRISSALYGKYWNQPQKKDFTQPDYRQLMEALKKCKLDFGVRAYIPGLISQCRYIPPNLWKVAAFTEGAFKKQTREAILKHWKNWKYN